jgi:spore germination protein YaaH
MLLHPPRRIGALGLVALAGILAAGSLAFDAASPGATTRAADPGIRARAHGKAAPSHEIYGYLPYWQVGADTAGSLDYARLSTIAFFAVPIRKTGYLQRTASGYRAYTSSGGKAIINAAHSRGVRVVPTFQLFDHGSLSRMRHFLASPKAQARFIHEALALMARRRADGANLDFEPLTASIAPQFAAFVRRFGRAMHQRFPGSRLVVATPAIVSDRLLRSLRPVVDRFFVMAYDYHWRGSTVPGAVAPLKSGPHNVAKTIANYVRLVPPSKLILGIPYYGYSWPVRKTGGTYRVRPNAGKFGGVRAVTYAGIRDWLRQHPSVTVLRDPAGGSWFRYWNTADHTMRQVHFEDPRSARSKFNFAIANGLAGVGIWALENDDGYAGMQTALDQIFVHPTRQATVRSHVAHVRRTAGTVRVSVSFGVRDRGTRAERGTLYWRILDSHGRTVASGGRTVAVYPGSRAGIGFSVRLGLAARLRAGTYRLRATFAAPGLKWRAPHVLFRQPY